MELKNMTDFEKSLQRFEAWWDRQIIDRPPVTIGVSTSKPRKTVAKHHASLRDRWLDGEYVLDLVEAGVESGVFMAETFPRYYPNLGPEICSACYGSDLTFTEGSSWSTPVLKNIRDVLKMKPDLDAFYWQWIRRQTQASVERSAGRWITGIADLHTQGDLLASLREPQDFCLDFMDDLEGVELACRHVTPEFDTYFNDLYRFIKPTGQPCMTWGGAPHHAPMYYVSCDFICMISPAHFARTILPAIEYEISRLDRSIFHLDGPGGLKHLDALLATELDAIQWTYGAGQGSAKDWLPVYKRCQAAGKSIEIHIQSPEDARIVMDHLKPEGAWLACGFTVSETEAKAFLKETERWASGKR